MTVLPEKTGSTESTDCQEPALDIIKSTLEQVRRRGFWFGWRRDVQRFYRQCQNCVSYHRGNLPRSGQLQPMRTGSGMERCHVDITGPHPRIARGSQYILTCVDAFSKWNL